MVTGELWSIPTGPGAPGPGCPMGASALRRRRAGRPGGGGRLMRLRGRQRQRAGNRARRPVYGSRPRLCAIGPTEIAPGVTTAAPPSPSSPPVDAGPARSPPVICSGRSSRDGRSSPLLLGRPGEAARFEPQPITGLEITLPRISTSLLSRSISPSSARTVHASGSSTRTTFFIVVRPWSSKISRIGVEPPRAAALLLEMDLFDDSPPFGCAGSGVMSRASALAQQPHDQ